MSTSGISGFIVDGEVKTIYCGQDAHPSGLGGDVFSFVKENRTSILSGNLKEKIRPIGLVKHDQSISEEEMDSLKEAGIRKTREADEWGSFFIQFDNFLEAGTIVDAKFFAGRSLFCEFGYVINLDNSTLEIYRGFQEEPHQDGCFADLGPWVRPNATWYPIRLQSVINIEHLPADDQIFYDLCCPENLLEEF